MIARLAAEPAVPATSLLDNLADQLQQAAPLRRRRGRPPRRRRPLGGPGRRVRGRSRPSRAASGSWCLGSVEGLPHCRLPFVRPPNFARDGPARPAKMQVGMALTPNALAAIGRTWPLRPPEPVAGWLLATTPGARSWGATTRGSRRIVRSLGETRDLRWPHATRHE